MQATRYVKPSLAETQWRKRSYVRRLVSARLSKHQEIRTSMSGCAWTSWHCLYRFLHLRRAQVFYHFLYVHLWPVAPGLLGTTCTACIISFICDGRRSFTLSFRDLRLLSFPACDWGEQVFLLRFPVCICQRSQWTTCSRSCRRSEAWCTWTS